MPFDPDAFLGKDASTKTGGSFDPDAFLAGKAEFVPPPALSSPTKVESAARGAAQGATLNFGDELTSAVDAGVEKLREVFTGKTSLAPGKGLGDKYQAALEQNRGQNKQAQEANPGSYSVGSLAGSLPAAIGTGGSSIPAMIGSAAAGGAIASLGESEGKSAEDATKEAAKSAAISGGLAAILGGTFKILSKGASTVGNTDAAKTFKMSYDLEKSLADPKVAQQIGKEFYQTGDEFAKISQEARSQIGQNLETIANRVTAKVNPDSVIKGVVDKLDKFNPGRNAIGQAAKDDLRDFITQVGQDLASQADETGKVSFQALHKLKQNLGETVFEQGLYKDNSYVDKLAKELYRGVSSSLKSADATGEYSNLSKVYQTLSTSDPEAFSANALKYFQDPFNVDNSRKLGRLLGDIQELSPEVQKQYIPQLAHFIDNNLPNAALKAELLKKAGGKTGIAALRGIPLPASAPLASNLGAAASSLKPVINTVNAAASGARGLIPIQGPIAGPAVRGALSDLSSKAGTQR